MATSKKTSPSAGTAVDQAVALAWGAWTELGVSGWTATHRNWAVDPEPLILFTARLGDVDPRLRDEATDWCVQHWRFVSKTRLKNLLRRQPESTQAAFGEFAATVGTHAGITWPGATTPRRYTPTGRSTLPPLERPSMVWLRLRAIFGLGARTEILRVFLAQPSAVLSAVRLADLTGYTKRNIAEEGETLQRAGLLAVRTTGNRFYFTLARRADLETFVGTLPEHRPDWTAVLNITRELVDLEHQAATGSPGPCRSRPDRRCGPSKPTSRTSTWRPRWSAPNRRTSGPPFAPGEPNTSAGGQPATGLRPDVATTQGL